MNHYPRIKGYQDVPANRPQKDAERAAISSQVEEYLKSGGVIKSVAHDATGEPFKHRNKKEHDEVLRSVVYNHKPRHEDGTTKWPRTINKGIALVDFEP